MQYRKLGRTDIDVSAIAFGCWAIVGGFNWGEQDERDSLDALRAAYDAGVTFFDTAEMYGDGYSERLIAKALGDIRDRVVIASKVAPANFAPDAFREALDRSLANLGTDYIDLYQLHWPRSDTPIDETLGLLDEARDAGKIRAYGVSNFARPSIAGCLATGRRIESNQLAYNLLFRGIELEIQPDCVANEISILCYCPIMQGLLAGKFRSADDVPEDRARTRHFSCDRPLARHSEQGHEELTFKTVAAINAVADDAGYSPANISIAWLLARPGVTAALVGGRNAEQARRNVAAAEIELSTDVIARLDAATDELKSVLGANVDLWQSDSRAF